MMWERTVVNHAKLGFTLSPKVSEFCWVSLPVMTPVRHRDIVVKIRGIMAHGAETLLQGVWFSLRYTVRRNP